MLIDEIRINQLQLWPKVKLLCPDWNSLN